VETCFDVQALNVVGAVEALSTIPAALWMAQRLLREARRRGTRTVVLIDAPGFNLPFAGWAKRAGMRVVYYVSPQIWAWRQRRVYKVAQRVDKMLTLFPFEVPFYKQFGVDAECVGHPLLAQLAGLPSPEAAASQLGLNPHDPIVALLPGSRRHEIRHLLSPMLKALEYIRHVLPRTQGILPVAPTIAPETLQPLLEQMSTPITLVPGQSQAALRAADFALIASGTATLEAGLIGTPMLIAYRVHPLTAWLARRLIRVPYIGLVNIVAGRALVPELVQRQVCPQRMAALALRCLQHPAEAQRIRHDLALLRTALDNGHSAYRAAACVHQVLCACITE
jgi:lipid-A-disaccharide synthase